ncbi:hypothetical protein BV20DRAFT_959335 [Pilatotrama ljubarskyi]|nr:hypothetical protein BV20DRAFT_959350 [Pilatotrama ljubarskyi]KAI0362922.1 hypothetical protein BV20DRAFT_959335 [Pilatotrama ljubarskyi]
MPGTGSKSPLWSSLTSSLPFQRCHLIIFFTTCTCVGCHTSMSGRRTRLKFNDFTSNLFSIHSRIDQGCPLSVIPYAF